MKNSMYRIASALTILMMLFAALPVSLAGATPLNITSVATGTWEATAWPNTQRSGTISVTAGNTTVTGVGTAFLTELSVGNILRTTTNFQIGTVASIASNTSLTLLNVPATTRTNVAYTAQGVGPADNVTIANSHNVTIAARAINQTGTVTVNSGGTLTVSNSGAVFSTLLVAGTVNGTSGNAFGALTVNNGGVVNAGTNGVYTASSLTVNSGGTINISRAFTVNGATAITGAINFSSTSVTARAMVFNGSVTLNSGATWAEATSGNGANNTYTFQHNFTNNASTFTTSSTSPHTFSGTGRTISGSSTTSIARVAIAGTYTNNGTLTVGTNLSGAGALTNSASGTLNAGGTVSLTTLTNAGTFTKSDAGPITIALPNFTNTGTINLNGTGTIKGITNNGTVNLNSSGLIYAFDNASATSKLNVYDLNPVPHFHTLIVSTAGNTVNYAGAGDQTVKPITYSNLVFSGAGTKFITMPSNSTLANGTMSIDPTLPADTAKAGVTGNNLSVVHLTMGGSGVVAGTWGATGSGATNTNDTYFAGTAGYLNVTEDSRDPQTITFTSTPPSNAEVGGTYTPTATASSGLTVTFTIDPGSTSVCSISSGVVSFDAAGTCEIDANQAGDGTYLPTTQQQSFDIKINQTINFTSTAPSNAIVDGDTYTPTATATSGLTVDFSIDPSAAAVCSMNAGVVSFEAAGTCVINANQPGDNDYHAAPQVQQSFIVKAGATVNLSIGGAPMTSSCTPSNSPYTVVAGASLRVSCAGIDNGPVKIDSDVNITAAERVIYKVNGVNTSFTEMMGLPDSQLDNVYWLPWYNNVNLDTQLRFANVSNNPTTVTVTIGGVAQAPINLAAGASTRISYPNIDAGPVKIESTQNIVAAERVIYKVNNVNTSFSEMMALPESQLDNVYWLPWYNNVNLDTQLRFANVSNNPTTVTVTIGGVAQAPINLAAGASTRISYPNIDAGPVKIESTQNIVAAERVIYKVNNVNTSFSEMMALPESQLDNVYWLPWYNNVNLDTQLRFANVSNNPTTVTVTIGNTTMPTINLAAGASTRISYPNIDAGPVKIESTQNIVAAERVIYKVNNVNTSFSEMMGLPDGLLDTTYWFPWYNNVHLDTQLRFGVP